MYFKVGSTMSLSLVLLLLPGILSQEVCLNISNGNVEINLQDLKLTDNWQDYVMNCTLGPGAGPCYINCSNMLNASELFQNKSSICSSVIWEQNSTLFQIEPYGKCSVFACSSNLSKFILNNVEQSEKPAKHLMVEIHLLRLMCRNLFSKDKDLQMLFIKTELQLIHRIMRTETYVTGEMHPLDLQYITFNIFPIGSENLTGNLIEVSQPNSDPLVCLPEEDLRNIVDDQRVVNVVNYESTQQFEFNEEVFQSSVARIEFLGERSLSNLSTPIEITFDTIINKTAGGECCYLDEHDFKWKTDGCNTVWNASVVTCKCSHTTAFSVLLIPIQGIAEIHWQILSYISYIGCGLSAFCSALSLMIYVITRKEREEPSIFIHVSLSGALFLLNSSFLLIEWGARLNPGWVCALIAALVHYSLLGTFSWMAVEGLHLYLMLIKVFNTEYKHYLLKLSLFGWGIPAVIVGVTWSLKDVKQIYGLSTLSLLDNNETNSICWIIDSTYLYATNVVYFSLVFIFNSGVLLIVAVRVCCMVTTPARPGLGCRTASTVAGLTCLLGVTWGLAFLGSGYVNYPVLYLFCILNTMQGVFVLLWILGLARIERKRAKEAKYASRSTNDTKGPSVKGT